MTAPGDFIDAGASRVTTVDLWEGQGFRLTLPDGQTVEVKALQRDARRATVFRLGISAPPSVRVMRGELRDRPRGEGR